MVGPGNGRIARREFFKPERLLAFSDGVFAVAITLLVIDLRLPPIPKDGGDVALTDALLGMEPKLFIFGLTFIIVGLGWVSHHRKFSYVGRVDARLLWLNLIYLMTLSLIPFATSVLSEHSSRIGFMVYGLVMALSLSLSTALSAYGLRAPFLIEGDLRPGVRKDMILSPLFTAVIFLGSVGLAFAHLEEAAHWSLLLIVPALAFFGSRARA
ncbi:MAG: TMEM175 family protein [Acetobacteraceae bacterium]